MSAQAELIELIAFSVSQVLTDVEPDYPTMLACLREIRQLIQENGGD